MMGELARALNASGRDISASPVSPERLAQLLALIDDGTISGAIAKGVFEKMFESHRAAGEIVPGEGLRQIDDEAQIVQLVADVLAANADAVPQYRAGKAATFGFLVAKAMKAAPRKANPSRLNATPQTALAT